MIIETAIIASCALLIGRYVLPTKRKPKFIDITFQRLDGTYRDPSLYEVTVTRPDKTEKYYKVRNVKEIPEPDRSIVVNGFMSRHRWMDNFLNGKDSINE